ncbi:MAG: universal stress protein [Woeseiaceae bacterium]|nr:universal stress protein [Woeseiaceae bacterium]
MRVILVPVADRPECARALGTAFDLGERLKASVSGCHIRPHRYSEVSMSTAFADAAWRRKSTKKAPAAAKAMYRRLAEEHDYEFVRRPRAAPAALWSERVGSPQILMSINGPVCDLIVVSRPVKSGGIADMFLKSALLESTKPVLILPQRSRKSIGRRVVVFWNQSAEAGRAVSASIPVLQHAEEVTIVTAGPEDRPGPKSAQVVGYLKHWGIKAVRVSTKGRQVEQELLGAYKELKGDLVVAGAYSRSRWREKVFGGTTEFLLRKARMPVFTQHH